MKTETLKNLLIFLDRVPVTGKEAIAWCMAHQELTEEVEKRSAPVAQAVPAAADAAGSA